MPVKKHKLLSSSKMSGMERRKYETYSFVLKIVSWEKIKHDSVVENKPKLSERDTNIWM